MVLPPFLLVVTDVIFTVAIGSYLGVMMADVFCQCGLLWPLYEMADVVAIVEGRIASFMVWLMLLSLWQMEYPHCEITNDVSLWQMEKPLCVDGWCYCHCGRWNCHIILYYIILGIWHSAVTSIHGDTISRTLHVFAAQATFHTVSYHFLRGSHSLPDQLPEEHTGPHLMQGSTSLLFDPSPQHFLHIHSLIVDRSMVVGHVPTDHMCSFMCTSHIDMTAHNPAFFTSWVALCELLYAHMT